MNTLSKNGVIDYDTIDQSINQAFEWFQCYVSNPQDPKLKDLVNPLVKSLFDRADGDIDTLWRFFGSRARLREDGTGDLVSGRRTENESSLRRPVCQMHRVHGLQERDLEELASPVQRIQRKEYEYSV